MTATTSSPARRHDADPGPIEVSVALCTWNGGRWIRAMLESLSAQTQLPDELIVHDDGSTDDTLALLGDFAAKAPFPVRISRNPVRLGSTRNFAAALGHCRGDVLLLADQDDIWYPSKIERLLDELETDPTMTMVFSDADLIGEDGRRVGRRLWDTRRVGGVLRRHPVVPEELFARHALTTGCTMAVRRRTLDAALPFPAVLEDEVAPMRHDRWLSLVAAATGTVRAMPEPLLGFRVHPAQQTGVLLDGQRREALGRAVGAVLRGDPDAEVPLHRARAAQLLAAAERADIVGDFEQAATLRRVARHHAVRGDRDAGLRDRLGQVITEIRDGGYGRGPLAAAAAAADVVRALRASEPEPVAS